MAGENLYRVWQNIKWRIESITPSASVYGIKPTFQHIEDENDPSVSHGYARHFQIEWDGMSGYDDVTDLTDVVGNHRFSVYVYYDRQKFRETATHKAMLTDQYDIVETLQSPDNWVGYNDSNSSTNIGLAALYVESLQRVSMDGEQLWVLKLNLRAKVFEPYN